MGNLEIGLYDVFDGFQMAEFPVAADVYDSHLRGAQEAEQMGISIISPLSIKPPVSAT